MIFMLLNCLPGRPAASAHGHQEPAHPGDGAARAEGVHGAAHGHPPDAEGLRVHVALARHAHRPRLRPRRHLRVAPVAVEAIVGLAALAAAEAEGGSPEAEICGKKNEFLPNPNPIS